MNWANYTLCGLYILALGIALGQHGKEKEGIENAWYSFIMVIILCVLLYFGGWFK